jgi:UDP-2,3-diacylglucosamine pyrophosphatase LpxH
MQKTYRSIFISDVHLGTRDCKAEQLNNFLKHNTCETLYLVGDIIDAWKIQQNKWRWNKKLRDQQLPPQLFGIIWCFS